MAITKNTFTGNGTTVLYSFSFPYLDQSHVKATLNGTPTTAFTFANATTLQFNSAPGAGVEIVIFRETDIDQSEAVFAAGSPIRAVDLNANFDQTLYVVQEINNYAVKLDDPLYANKTYIDAQDATKVSKSGDTMTGQLAMSGNRIINIGDPVNLQDVATKNWVSGLAFTGVNLPDFQFDGGFANSTYGGTFLFLDGGNA
jgi:hypothetical protein